MLIGERMTHPVITVSPDLPIADALSLMRKEHIRRTPVTQDGKLIGIVSNEDLLNASPSPATSLSVFEMTYLLSKITVKDVMSKNVLTITEDMPIEEGARIMADNKIGGLPVVRGEELVGIITETDLFKVFLELMGAREKGVRVAVLIANISGKLAGLAGSIASKGGNFIAFGSFLGDDPSNRELTFKVTGLSEAEVRTQIEPIVERIMDIRTC
jgi:acetoin utilization protein AcuB